MARRGGFQGGMPGNMNNLMKQAQKMQRQMEEQQKEMEDKEFEATDIEMLEDLIVAATNEALRKMETDNAKAMEALTGGLNLGGGFPF